MASRKYIQWLKNSAGYVPGSKPPRYSKEYVKPIHAVGGDSVEYLDGRLSKQNLVAYATEQMAKRIKIHPNTVGFEIRQTHDGRFSNSKKLMSFIAG